MLNLRRGLFRTWICLSVLWVSVIGGVTLTHAYGVARENDWGIFEFDEVMKPDPNNPGELIWVPCSELPASECAPTPGPSEFGVWWSAFETPVEATFVPPVGLLFAGLATLWVVTGFRAPSRMPTLTAGD